MILPSVSWDMFCPIATLPKLRVVGPNPIYRSLEQLVAFLVANCFSFYSLYNYSFFTVRVINLILQGENNMNKQSLKVTDLDFSVRCLNILKVNNIEYLNELTKYSLSDLANFKGMSRPTVYRIIKMLKDNDLALKGETL
jgi:DNA-directed RNA polymerase alpha subunit